jgi:hypothetical protein
MLVAVFYFAVKIINGVVSVNEVIVGGLFVSSYEH